MMTSPDETLVRLKVNSAAGVPFVTLTSFVPASKARKFSMAGCGGGICAGTAVCVAGGGRTWRGAGGVNGGRGGCWASARVHIKVPRPRAKKKRLEQVRFIGPARVAGAM